MTDAIKIMNRDGTKTYYAVLYHYGSLIPLRKGHRRKTDAVRYGHQVRARHKSLLLAGLYPTGDK
jgi:hypothetical protein